LAPGPLRVGTRGSPMAPRQTTVVRERLIAAHPELAETGAVEIVTIRTTGDRSGGPFAEGHGDLLPVGLGPEARHAITRITPVSAVQTTAAGEFA
jgi:Porphobilinogen deaminase, dipyromethane cofactor binding domain